MASERQVSLLFHFLADFAQGGERLVLEVDWAPTFCAKVILFSVLGALGIVAEFALDAASLVNRVLLLDGVKRQSAARGKLPCVALPRKRQQRNRGKKSKANGAKRNSPHIILAQFPKV